MPLTPDQQAAADALTGAFGKFMNLVGSASTTPAPAPAPVLVRWHRPTAEETAAFAAEIGWTVADLEGDRAANAATTEFPNPTWPAIPPCETEEALKRRAKHGFNSRGVRPNFTSDGRAQTRKMCDRIADSPTPDPKDTGFKGTEVPGRTTDLDIYLVSTVQTKNVGPFGEGELDQRSGSNKTPWLTLADAIAGEKDMGTGPEARTL